MHLKGFFSLNFFLRSTILTSIPVVVQLASAEKEAKPSMPSLTDNEGHDDSCSSPNLLPSRARDVGTTEEGASRGSPALSRSRTEVTGLITDFSLIQKFREKFMASELLETYQAMLWKRKYEDSRHHISQ